MVWGPESGSKTAHFTSLTFTILPWGGLRSRIWSQDGSFNFLPGGGKVLNQVPRRLLYLFTWEWSEVQNQGPRRLILAFYTWIRPQDGSFYYLPFYLECVWGPQLDPKTALFTCLHFYRGMVWGPDSSSKTSFYLSNFFPFYVGVVWGPEAVPKTAQFTVIFFYQGVVWGPESGPKTAHFTFYLGRTQVQNQCQDGLFYLFTWGLSEVQNQTLRRLMGG